LFVRMFCLIRSCLMSGLRNLWQSNA
jgi:hypothetical protein